jgi:ketosteroid isomerase-like protein
MMRVDFLLDNLEQDNFLDLKLRNKLLSVRQSIHELIGELPTKIHGESSDNEETSVEIRSLIVSRFVRGLNSRSIFELSKIRSRSDFTMFDDVPPLDLLDFEESQRHDNDLFNSVDTRDFQIRDLRIQTFGRTAVATFHCTYMITVKEANGVLKSRVTLVLEMRAGRWKVVHEHWSQADPVEVLDKMQGLKNLVISPPET